jgi:hypothetical protein
MKTISANFLGMPRTGLGWWAVGLSAAFVAMFVLATNNIVHLSGLLIMLCGLVAGILELEAVIANRERSWLVWLMLLPGLFALLFALGEMLMPMSY